MALKTAYSTKENVREAVKEISKELDGFPLKMLLYFASSNHPPQELATSMQETFPVPLLYGCSTAGEIVTGKMLKNSVVVMAFDEEIIEDAAVEVVENVQDLQQVKAALDSFSRYFSEPVSGMDPKKYVGIILIDGLSLAEELVMDRIGDLTNVLFVGGSAGDDLKFQQTSVFYQGKAYHNAAVLAILKPAVTFDIIKTQSFELLDKTFTANRVNTAAREVLEFDGIPAVEAYSNALGISPAEAPDYFMSNPVGFLIGDDIYVRSPSRVEGNSLLFYCQILEGMQVSLLRSTDIVEDTRQALERKKKEMGGLAAVINFHCILRTLELEKNNQTAAYGNVFSEIPTIGFSTYGEEYIGHINQTSTMLVFGLSKQ